MLGRVDRSGYTYCFLAENLSQGIHHAEVRATRQGNRILVARRAAGPQSHDIFGSLFRSHLQCAARVAPRSILRAAAVIVLHVTRRGPCKVAADLIILPSHDHGMDGIVDEQRNGLARKRVKPDHGQRFVRRPLIVVAQPPAVLARIFPPIDIHISLSRPCPDLCRLEALFRLADGFDGSVFNLFGVDRRLRRVVAIHAERRRRAVVVHRSQDQVFGGDAGLLRDPLRHGFPDPVGHADQFPGDDGRGPGAIAQHDSPRVDVIVNALETLFAAGIAAHWQGRVGGRRDIDFCGARLQRPAFGRLRRLKFRAKEKRWRKQQGHIQQERSPDRGCAR